MRWTDRVISAFRSLFRRPRVERELDAELEFHLANDAAERMAAGMDAAEARTAAARAFGSVAYIKEDCRNSLGLRLLDETREDLRYALRTLTGNPAFTAIAVLTLALGIGANAAIFTLLDAVLLKPLPVPAPGELMTLYENGPEGAADAAGGTGRFLRFSYPRFERLERALASHGMLAAVTRSSRFVVRLPGSREPQYLRGQLVSGGYFATLRVSAARGRVLTPDDVRADAPAPVAVVSDGLARRLLGGADAAIGQIFVINGVSVTVVGTAPPWFVGIWTDSEADVWLPATLQPALKYQNNSSTYGTVDDNAWPAQDLVAWLNLVARIPVAERSRAVQLLQAANRRGVEDLAGTFPSATSRAGMLAHRLVVEPLSHGFSGLRARFADALFALSAMVALVLLATCANVASLLLARAAGHARNMAIRISLGASTGRLVRQCLTESLLLALIGGAAGAMVGKWASGLLAHQVLATSSQLPQVFAPDTRMMAFTIGLSLVTAALFGLAPALRAIEAGRTAAVATNQRHAVGMATMRGMQTLVVFQLALSVVVVFAAILLGLTLDNLMRIDPGFSAGRLVTVSFDAPGSGYRADQMPALTRRLVAAVRTLPGVTSAAASTCGLIAGCRSSSGFRFEGGDDTTSTANENWVGAGYFATVGIPIVAGREFDERDTERRGRVAVVNESLVRRYFRGQNPIGRRLGYSQADTEIVGVVRDARTQTLHEAPVPMVYFPIDQNTTNLRAPPENLDVRVAGDPRAAVAAVRESIQRAEPGLLLAGVDVTAGHLSRDLSRERTVAMLAFGFALLTLLLGSLGLYGVLANGVARRTQEIGVRMALGARRAEVLALVLGQGARLTAAGLALGLLAAAIAARYVSRILFGVQPLDPAVFVAVLLVFGTVSVAASYIPARRATRVDPVIALRSE